ncbi:MAG: succinate dehydrogenase cytochrome b subunit [Muribaculaceae bacterium]|nr:succinate dehydrogenase cytochrome b subunit [Muribaculaceae bacterium]MDE6561205.1 succinate dehydrogenase cytochrome b subunit [Muribaculaceae bacterium]
MWLTCSSVGRKFIMALTGACLVLFLTFHCVMNAVCICWPEAYNSICEFLGANWYALIASVGLAVLFILHICYAVWLTLQNRKARGEVRYAIEHRPANVEWSSQNMLVLGIVVLAFLVVHMIQFWAKMQWVEICGDHGSLPAAAGTLFIQEAFSKVWTPIVYLIAFIALWFHLQHGFWSMFQSVGWDSTVWIPRLKKIGNCWVSIVIALFVAQAIVFTVRAHEDYYKTNPKLRAQYKTMLAPMFLEDFGPDAAQFIEVAPYENVSGQIRQMAEQMDSDQARAMRENDPKFEGQLNTVKAAAALFEYLEEGDAQNDEMNPMMVQPQ